jgi:DNA-directed RNA polymerase specialized sigma24 family protein
MTEQGLKLREAADMLGLTISQVHRRVEQAREHLRRSPRVVQWREAALM